MLNLWYRVDDMLAILFPHMFEDVEYLIPDEARANGHANGPTRSSFESDAAAGTQLNEALPQTKPRQENAIAGPSRLAQY